MVNSEDDAVAYYSNNKVKKLFKKPFSPKYRSKNEFKGNTSLGKCTRMESKEEKKENKSVVEKSEKKVEGRFRILL